MIPLQLHIKNFVSYGTLQVIDFEPYGLMCLSGKNGHGKSALLDALTWAVWGQARKPSGVVKADESLLHLGQTHMMVSLDFLCNGITYRIKREYTQRKNSGVSSLEFGIVDGAGSVKPLTDKTIRDTQHKIIATVGLDYEGFTNSAFLKQGGSQTFSRKTPRERKEILAAILGLEHFEEVRRLALDIVKATNNEKDKSMALLTQYEEELKQKTQIEQDLNAIKKSLAELEQQQATIAAQQELYSKHLEKARKEKAEIENIRFKQTHLAQALDQEVHQIQTQFSTWRSIAKKQRTSMALPHLEKERQDVQKELNEMQLIAARKVTHKEEFLTKKEALSTLQRDLETAHQQTLVELEKKIHACLHELNSSTAQHEERAKKYQILTAELEALRTELVKKKSSLKLVTPETISAKEKHLERRKSFYQSFVSKAHTLKNTLASLGQKISLIVSSEQALCPLCEQVTDKTTLTQKFSQEQHLRNHQLKRLTTVCSTLKPSLVEEYQALETLKKQREEYQLLHVHLQQMEKQYIKGTEDAQTVAKELATLEQTRALLHKQHQQLLVEQQRLTVQFQQQSQNPALKKLQTEVVAAEKAWQELPYDPQKEHALAARLSALNAHSTQQQSLIKEIALQDERKRTIHEKCARAKTIKHELITLKKQLPPAPMDYQALVDQATKLSHVNVELHKTKETLIRSQGSLEAQRTALQQKEHLAKEQQKAIKLAQTKIEEYTAIAAAFSKDGIQALLIEDALPEIEEEANNLLSRLTDNQAHISIDSLKDTKSGKTKETLDIKISDAAGVRPYEMFSGGEAFRIDFSLRVALSKLLARRAGTALQTLIIDEGFGSQDEDGLSHIMDALHTIQDDFSKIIVVSHLTALKEQFPVHFMVHKTPQGTVVKAIEHC